MEQWVLEAAAAELENLENDHPDRFNYLKLELRNLISPPSPPHSTSYHSVPTQASSSRRKRKAQVSPEEEAPMVAKRRRWPSLSSADMAMERAAECLKKLRMVKESLLTNG